MAGTSVTDDVKPRQRRSSLDLLPPNMSELRLVLLGNNWSERSSVANFILEENVFSSQREPDNCEKVRGKLKKEFVLINTPNLLHSNTSDMQMREHVEHCACLSKPGPHVFLLVLDSEDFTEEHRLRLCTVLEILGDQSFARSLILISGKNYRSQIPLKDIIRKCSYRYLMMENLEMEELLTRLRQTQTQVEIIMKEKEEENLRREHKDMTRKITELKGENERERKLRANEQTEKDKCINKEREERKRQREEDEKRWKKQKETLREECRKKVETSEKKAHLEREQREAAERKLEQCRKEIKKSQDAWDKEKRNCGNKDIRT